MTPKPTLQTVADAVGVSRSTVSNAYSRPDQLSPELRDRILGTAIRLGYSGPNPTARSLRRGRVGAIGVLFTDSLSSAFSDPYSVQFLGGLAEEAEHRRTGLLLIPLADGDPEETAEEASETVQQAAVDGFVVHCVPDWHPALPALATRGLPTVLTDLRPADGTAMAVGIDEADATREAGRHLVALGHERIAVLTIGSSTEGKVSVLPPGTLDDIPYWMTRERLRGYAEAFTDGGVDWKTVTVVSAPTVTPEDGAVAAALVLDRAPRPTAIVALADVLALGVLDALATRGLRPGVDVSVIGFDDIPAAATAGLTTVRQPSRQKGRRAGALLLDPPADAADRRVVLPAGLVVRASTGPAPTWRS